MTCYISIIRRLNLSIQNLDGKIIVVYMIVRKQCEVNSNFPTSKKILTLSLTYGQVKRYIVPSIELHISLLSNK